MQRQTKRGGFNGRTEKLADVCYTWWVLSACHIINSHSWVDEQRLVSFAMSC